MHSWRVLILPFLDEQGLYDLYDFSEPWDGPNNSKLLGKMPRIFHCPGRNTGKPTSLTSYVVVRGNDTMFPGPGSVRIEQVTDRLSDTILAAEVANVTIPWTKPEDLDLLTMSFADQRSGSSQYFEQSPRGSQRCSRRHELSVHTRIDEPRCN